MYICGGKVLNLWVPVFPDPGPIASVQSVSDAVHACTSKIKMEKTKEVSHAIAERCCECVSYEFLVEDCADSVPARESSAARERVVMVIEMNLNRMPEPYRPTPNSTGVRR